jgi:probable HAF family extracellular repeat protein
MKFLSVLAALVAIFTIPVSAQNYSFTKVISYSGAPIGWINSAGQIAGTANNSSPTSAAFIWSRSEGIQYLGNLGGGTSYAYGINDSGEVVGASTVPDGTFHAFLWTKTGGMQDLGTPVEGDNSWGSFINSSGEVLGQYEPPNGSQNFDFFWSASTGLIDLGALGNGYYVTGSAINSSGEIVGISNTQPNGLAPYYAFSWTKPAGMINLAPSSSDEGSTANWINNSGQIVGAAETNQNQPDQATLWTPSGVQKNLGTLPGDTESDAFFITNSGNVGGSSENPTKSEFHVFFWSPSGGMINIGAPPYSDYIAMNNNNQILIQESNNDPYLWTETGGIQLVHQGSNQYLPGYGGFNDAGQLLLEFGGNIYIGIPVMRVALTSSPNPSTVGERVTLVATVTSVVGPPPNGEDIDFYMGTTKLGTASLSNGKASFAISTLPQGSDEIKAKYVGDINYLDSASSAVTQVVTP